MKNFVTFALTCLGLLIAVPVSADITGVTVADAVACEASNLDAKSKDLLNRRIDADEKLAAKTLTIEEFIEASAMPCGLLVGGLVSKLVLTDGLDYLIEICPEKVGCLTLITKDNGFERDGE